MSALFGIVHTDGRRVERETLARMSAVLAHRGGDASADWCDGAVGFGHRMFWTTPESLQETLPCADPARGLAITADARIDNRDALCRDLGCAADVADSQLILAAYARWGADCVRHLDGDFAFAIWDSRARQLFCARDVFGLKPFFFAQPPGAFVFASEIKGVLAAGVPDAVNADYLTGYLLTLFDDPRATAQDGIYRLPAAHTLTATADGVTVRRYWSLDDVRELRLGSDAAYAEAFRDTFAEAVRCRLRSAYPVGSTLSGGMDSSSIACMARHLYAAEGRGRQIHTYSATFDAYPACDERPYIQAVIDQGDSIAHLVPVDGMGPFAAYLASQPVQDGPYVGTTHYIHLQLYTAARGTVRVMLDGHGGDSVVSHGSTYLAELARHGRFLTLYREARAFAGRADTSLRTVLGACCLPPCLPRPLRRLWRGAHDRRRHEALLAQALIAPDAIERARLHERLTAARRRDFPHTSVRAEQQDELTRLVYTLVFEWFNTTAHTFDLETRYPFFDRRLAELCVAFPPEQKLRQGWTRMVLRRAMDGILPPAVQWRAGKADLSPCFYGNLRTRDRALLADVLARGMSCVSPYLDSAKLWEDQRLWAADGALSLGRWQPVWFAATLAAWLLQRQQAGIEVPEAAALSA